MTIIHGTDPIVAEIQRKFGDVKFPILHGDSEQVAELITAVLQVAPRLVGTAVTVPEGARDDAVNRLRLAMEDPRHDPNLLLDQVLSDMGILGVVTPKPVED